MSWCDCENNEEFEIDIMVVAVKTLATGRQGAEWEGEWR